MSAWKRNGWMHSRLDRLTSKRLKLTLSSLEFPSHATCPHMGTPHLSLSILPKTWILSPSTLPGTMLLSRQAYHVRTAEHCASIPVPNHSSGR